jgi:hypothetical protein
VPRPARPSIDGWDTPEILVEPTDYFLNIITFYVYVTVTGCQ